MGSRGQGMDAEVHLWCEDGRTHTLVGSSVEVPLKALLRLQIHLMSWEVGAGEVSGKGLPEPSGPDLRPLPPSQMLAGHPAPRLSNQSVLL